MRKIIPVLAAFAIATVGAASAAQAALVDFGVGTLGGTLAYSGGSTLDTSASFDLDNSSLSVTNIGTGDESGLNIFPGINITVTLTHPINYGSGSGVMNTPI